MDDDDDGGGDSDDQAVTGLAPCSVMCSLTSAHMLH